MPDGVAVALVVLYSLLGFHVLGQIVLLWLQRHKPYSYKVVFNWCALSWMLIRAIFWGMNSSSADNNLDGDAQYVMFYLLFWFPHCILYLTFATLALFFTKVIKRRDWTGKHRNKFLMVYGLFGVMDLIGTVILSILAGQDEAANSGYYGNIESLGTGFLFLILSFGYVVLAYYLRNLGEWEYNRMFMFRPKTTSIVTLVLAAIFASRSIFNFLTYSGKVTVDISDETPSGAATIICAYLAWEFFPLVLLLSTIATGPVGQGKQPAANETLSFGVFGAIHAVEEADAEAALERLIAPEESGEMSGYSMNMPSHPREPNEQRALPASSAGLGSPGGLGHPGGLYFSTSASSAQVPIPSGSHPMPGAGLGRPGGVSAVARSMGIAEGSARSHDSHGPFMPYDGGHSRASSSNYTGGRPSSVHSTQYAASMLSSGGIGSPLVTGRNAQLGASTYIGSIPPSQLPALHNASPKTPITSLLYEQHTADTPTIGKIYNTINEAANPGAAQRSSGPM